VTFRSAVVDSGATGSFIRPQDGAIPTGVKSNKVVTMPTGNSTNASEEARLPMTQLNDQARECDILPGLKYNSLISVGKLAAAGYSTIFDSVDGTVKSTKRKT